MQCVQEYCLSRDDLDFVLSVTKFKGKEAWKEDPMSEVETQTKSAFTRAFNKTEHKARCNLAVEEFKKGKGKKGKAAAEPRDDSLGEWLKYRCICFDGPGHTCESQHDCIMRSAAVRKQTARAKGT